MSYVIGIFVATGHRAYTDHRLQPRDADHTLYLNPCIIITIILSERHACMYAVSMPVDQSGSGCLWMHRSPHLWKDPDTFRPERFSETNCNEGFKGAWAGYRPEAQGSSLYPNEVAADFAFIPFGGGSRKCVGDQFALTEAVVAITMLLR